MIIGISGKLQNGKNTVGTIIQYLSWCKLNSIIENKEHYTLFYNKQNYDKNVSSGWTQKAFASKLKQCVSIITGIPIEDLEKEEVKNKVLGEEWNVVDKVCNICGKNWNNDPFNLFNLSNGKTYCSSCKNGIYLDSTKKITVRKLLQLLGTEVGREIHPNFWVNALFADYKSNGNLAFERLDSSERLPLTNDPNDFMFPKWIITDVRFPNELQAIKDKGGIVIRVDRPNLIENNHLSETSLDSAIFDFVINNDKDIEHLINEVRKIFEKLSII